MTTRTDAAAAGGRMIAIVVTDDVQLLDVSGPADVFAEANAQSGTAAYRVEVVAASPGTVRSSCGMRLGVDRTLAETGGVAYDTLLVAGAPRLHRRSRDEDMLTRLRTLARDARRFGSVCTGAVLLAEAGLLDGVRATTHWAIAEAFAERFPAVSLEIDAIHVRDGRARTAAGVTAGLDLALALVEEDLGRDLARRVAGHLVMYFRRPGGQLQHGRQPAGSPTGRSILQDVQRWVAAHPGGRLDVATLAARAGLSPRHFARLFRAEIGETPALWVEGARIDAARRLLDEGGAPKVVAARCGFRDVETFRRAFRRRLGITPASYARGHSAGRDG